MTEYDINYKKFRVVVREEIPRSEWTYDNAVQKIIQLNEIYDPAFIYVDAGSGEYQVESLRKHGKNNPETGLINKVKRIAFQQNIEIRDPATNEIDKKDAKNFMINQTSILLERDKLMLSPFDDMVWKQMMDYRVVRVTQTGRPIYTSENEHALDAFMLTILGFTQEFPNLTAVIDKFEPAKKSYAKPSKIQENIEKKVFGGHKEVFKTSKNQVKRDPNEHRDDQPKYNRVALGYHKKKSNTGWGGRGSMKGSSMSRSSF